MLFLRLAKTLGLTLSSPLFLIKQQPMTRPKANDGDFGVPKPRSLSNGC
jgi:hypothetical protein